MGGRELERIAEVRARGIDPRSRAGDGAGGRNHQEEPEDGPGGAQHGGQEGWHEAPTRFAPAGFHGCAAEAGGGVYSTAGCGSTSSRSVFSIVQTSVQSCDSTMVPSVSITKAAFGAVP